MATTTATVRDRVWAAALSLADRRGSFTVADVLAAADLSERQRETARDTLNAMADADVLAHRSGSPTWERPTDAEPTTTLLRDRNAHPYTFRDPAIREWIEARLRGRVLNLCAGRTRLSHPDDGEIVRNDQDPDVPTDTHIDAAYVGDHFSAEAFDTVVFDPPWSEGLVKRRGLYSGEYVDMYAQALDGIAAVIRPGGRVITFGYDSSGLGERRGFTLDEVCLIHFTGNHNDAVVTVERHARTEGRRSRR